MFELRILLNGLKFPEGPCFASDGILWWVEVDGGRIGCLRPDGPKFFEIGGRPNGAAFDGCGVLWIADQGRNEVRRFDTASGVASTVAGDVDGAALGMPNDLCFDLAGNLVFTCSNNARTEPVGYVCRLTPNGDVAKISDGLMFPNGIAIAPDGALVIAETYRQRLLRVPYGKTVGKLDTFAATGGPVGPDGIAFASDGSLFVANFGQGSVTHHADDGSLIATLQLPGAKPTNVALDPSGTLGLVVTEAETGALYSATTNRRPWFPGKPPTNV
ncbi:SMP-30/gluconolactonase/LRE family protein [Oricola indica]|uniref:SMP-30/gluconolactonase/LRE family protein n=1 Tax=Oricola indica TaxID=2872591 RepID=UPI001CBAC632|nr:SMP-30/gluconolactonase/LRE family protein [Oricola indica]